MVALGSDSFLWQLSAYAGDHKDAPNQQDAAVTSKSMATWVRSPSAAQEEVVLNLNFAQEYEINNMQENAI